MVSRAASTLAQYSVYILRYGTISRKMSAILVDPPSHVAYLTGGGEVVIQNGWLLLYHYWWTRDGTTLPAPDPFAPATPSPWRTVSRAMRA